jgi:DNA-binding NtrC family response regulator
MLTRILVVDDEPGVRETLIANLELEEGFEVVGAESGEQALALLARDRFDVVLSDVRMPGMNGVELYRQLVQMRPGMPVVLMTAFALEGLVQEAVREGVFTVLPKPSSIDAISKTLVSAARRPIVLVIDDEASLAFATVESLRTAGLRAAAAYDGEAAVRAVGRGAVDVCVLDLVMPGLSTEDIVQLIRSSNDAVALIAILEGQPPSSMLKMAVQLEGMIEKPIDVGALIDVIAKARRNAPQRAAAA